MLRLQGKNTYGAQEAMVLQIEPLPLRVEPLPLHVEPMVLQPKHLSESAEPLPLQKKVNQTNF